MKRYLYMLVSVVTVMVFSSQMLAPDTSDTLVRNPAGLELITPVQLVDVNKTPYHFDCIEAVTVEQITGMSLDFLVPGIPVKCRCKT